MFDVNLRRNKAGNRSLWSNNELLAGFNHYYGLFGHFPSAHEIDTFEYLPSSRSIQRSYGGLVKLRSELLPAEVSNYTKGEHRSSVAKRMYKNGRAYEKDFYEFLITNFYEIAVHEHKLVRPGDVSSDFFIYMTETTGVVIDIFFAASIINLVNVVNIKLKRYILIKQPTYLVIVGNDSITQDMINARVRNRQAPLPEHISIYTEIYFKSDVIPALRQKSEYSRITK